MTKQAEVLDAVTNQVKEQHIDPLTAKVEKCYSQERYEDFQKAVEKIIARYLKSVIGWAGLVWIATIIGSMFLQKLLKIFGT